MEDYEVLGQIGKGSFGLVQKIKRKSDGKVLVWKEMNFGKMTEREKQQLVAEVNIIRELNHPNIVRYYDRIIDKKETKIFIIMEYCECGDLGTLLKKCKKEKDYIAEDIIWKIFTQILLALNECHSRTGGKILHRDLKPANLFLDAQNNIKLGDFGLSRVMGENSVFATTHVGTPYYMSPEQIQESKYNETSDIWSAGCLLYEMAALKPPFEATNHLSLAIKIKAGKFERLPLRYSEELQQLVERMIHTDAKKRPSVAQLMELPQVSLRLKERRLRDTHAVIKQKEDALKKREEQMQVRTAEVDEKDKQIKTQEKELLELKEEIKQLEITEKKQISSNLSNEIVLLPSQPLRSSRLTEYQLISPTLTSFGKDLSGWNLSKENPGNLNLTEQSSLGTCIKNSQSSSITTGGTDVLRIGKENHDQTNFRQTSSTFCAYQKEKAVHKSLIAGNKQTREFDGNNNNSQDVSSPVANSQATRVSQQRESSNATSNNNSSAASLNLKHKNNSQYSENSESLENNGCQGQSINHFSSVAPSSGRNSSGSACAYSSSSKKEEDSTAHSTGIKAALLSAKQDQSSDKSSGKISHESNSSKQEVQIETGFDKYKARLISERATAVRERILSTEGRVNQKLDMQQELKDNSSKIRRNESVEASRKYVPEQGGYYLNQQGQAGKESEINQNTSSLKTPRQADSVVEFNSTRNNSGMQQEKAISKTKYSDHHSENYKEIPAKQQQYTSKYSGSVIQSNVIPRAAPKLLLRPHAESRTKTIQDNYAFTSLQQQYSSGISKPPLQPLSASEEATTLQSNSEVISQGSGGNSYIMPKKISSTNSSFSAVPSSQTYFRTTSNYLSNQTHEQHSRNIQLSYRTASYERKQVLPLSNSGVANGQNISNKTRGGSSGERPKGCLTENAIQNKNNQKHTQGDYSRMVGYKPKTCITNYSSQTTSTTGSSSGARIIPGQQQIFKAPPSPTAISHSSTQY